MTSVAPLFCSGDYIKHASTNSSLFQPGKCNEFPAETVLNVTQFPASANLTGTSIISVGGVIFYSLFVPDGSSGWTQYSVSQVSVVNPPSAPIYDYVTGSDRLTAVGTNNPINPVSGIVSIDGTVAAATMDLTSDASYRINFFVSNNEDFSETRCSVFNGAVAVSPTPYTVTTGDNVIVFTAPVTSLNLIFSKDDGGELEEAIQITSLTVTPN